MAVPTGPRIRRTAQNTQYTYNLSRRIHSVQTYPIISPQGATIVLYGHENGVTIVWRGGRRFKASAYAVAAQKNSKQNGKPVDDAVMIIDSDDEGPPAASTFVDQPQFEAVADEDATYPEITQTLDLFLGTAVFHIETLPMAPSAAEDAGGDGFGLLTKKIVFAASCATQEVYLVTLPLTPPSPTSKAREGLRENLLAGKAGNGKWGETMTLLAGQEKPSDALAMTLIKPNIASERSKSSDRSRSAGTTIPRVVVASHSREAAGTLRLWDVPLEKTAVRAIQPFQTEFLPSPLASISFNPTHSTQLLCNASPHAVRVYDFAVASMAPDDLSEGPFPSQGSWLISLYPPFARPSASRKPILAASWIAHGRAVLVLLADGQWGIWDIDGVSPQGPALFGKHGSGIRGAALTSFSATGFIEGTNLLRNLGPQRASGTGADFVPMTPHTRREAMSISSGPERLTAVKGGIVVTALPARSTTTADESAILWIGSSEHLVVIPGMLKFWDAQLRKGAGGGVNLFSGAQPTRMVRLSDLTVGLMGERCIGVGAICRVGGSDHATNEGLPIDVLVCGESRLVIVQESETVVGTRIGGIMGRSKRPNDWARDTSAIIAHPRPEQPPSQMYNLTINSRKKLSELQSTPPADKVVPSTEMEEQVPSRAKTGFAFLDSLDAAADAMQDEDEEERDVEEELLDIMDIDRELDAMNDGRGRGRKKVVFDS